MVAPVSEVRLDRVGDATVLTIDRPAVHNAISRATMGDLAEALDEVAASDTRVLAVRGAGTRTFISGGDLNELATIRRHDEARDMALRMRSLLDRLATLPIPVVAGVNGHAFGGGCETAVACDFRIAAHDVRMAFNQVDLAITPAWGGIERLQALAGRSRALYLTTTGIPIDASTALAWGLVEEVVDRNAFDTRLGTLIERLARVPRATLVGIKATASRAQSPVNPDLAAAAAEVFADSWIADTHWTAAEQAASRRRARIKPSVAP